MSGHLSLVSAMLFMNALAFNKETNLRCACGMPATLNTGTNSWESDMVTFLPRADVLH